MNRFTSFCEPDCHNAACSASLLSGVAKATSDKIYYTPYFYIANRKLRYYFDFVNRILLINFNFARRTFEKEIQFSLRFSSFSKMLFQLSVFLVRTHLSAHRFISFRDLKTFFHVVASVYKSFFTACFSNDLNPFSVHRD